MPEDDNCHCAGTKSCGKSHGKERPKRKALRRPRKTDIEGADMTFGHTVPSTGSNNRKGSIISISK